MPVTVAQALALLKGCHPDATLACWDADKGAWLHARLELVTDGASRLPNLVKIGTVGHFEDAAMLTLPDVEPSNEPKP